MHPCKEAHDVDDVLKEVNPDTTSKTNGDLGGDGGDVEQLTTQKELEEDNELVGVACVHFVPFTFYARLAQLTLLRRVYSFTQPEDFKGVLVKT